MSKIYLALLIIFFQINIISSDSKFKIPFKLFSTYHLFPNHTEPIHPIAKKCMSQIVIELSMGTPPQKLNCSLNLITFHSFFLSHRIPNINITSFYNKSLSSTYKCSKELEEYKNEDFDQAEIFSDNIQLFSDDGEKIFEDKFNFFLIDNLGENILNEFYTPGIIGLKLGVHNHIKYPKDLNFPYQIKSKDLSDNYIFSFEFNKKNNTNPEEGYFVVGKELPEPSKMAKLSIRGNEWSINFGKIYYGNTEFEFEEQALIETEYGLTVGTVEYEEIIQEFFNKQKNCYLGKIKMGYESYNYFYCDEDFDETKMENLTFILSLHRTDINFTFTGKELFFTEEGKKYFKIIFFAYPNYIWYFGRDFLKKYRLYFDIEGKAIYIHYDRSFSFSSLIKKKYFWTIIFIVLVIIIFYLISFLKKDKRKKRKNELDEELNQEDLKDV